MLTSISLILLIVGAVLIITEVIIGVEAGFDLLLLGSCLFVGGLVGYYTNDYIGAFTAALLSVGYISAGRKYIKNKVQAYTHTSNVDTLLNNVVTVKRFDNDRKVGTTNVKGEEWRIVSENILQENQQVKVISIDGVSLLVEPLEMEA
jgi:membrane protein implicated in regulation of membrane protease activity